MTKKEYLTHLDYGVKTCPAIRDAFKELIEEHFELSNVIREESDDIQTVIDLLDSKVVTMGHINVAIKKLEIIQDKLMGVKEDA